MTTIRVLTCVYKFCNVRLLLRLALPVMLLLLTLAGQAAPLPSQIPVAGAPIEVSAALKKSEHPHLFINAQKLDALRVAIKTTHAALWSNLLATADAAVRHGTPKYRASDDGSGDEQLWQRDVGNAMPTLAMAWKLSGKRTYLDAARAWALASCSYPTWGLGKYDGHDLAAGHQLFGLAMVYDWCHTDLDAETLRTIRATLERRGAAMAVVTPGRHNFLQNHLWVDACGMAAAGMAIQDEFPAARGWVACTLDKWRRTLAALGPDGASHEGAGYWSYGVEYLLKFMWLAREQMGVDFYDNPWWRKTADYRLYVSLPLHAMTPTNSVVDIADGARAGYSYGPDYLLRALAQEFRDGHAQWLAAELDAIRTDGLASPWLNLIFYDPAIVPHSPNDLPTLRHFSDMDIVSARSDWSGDESLVVFKCGPYIGHKAFRDFTIDPGGGHVHPDANHFCIFGAGDWLIRNDGYRWKWTAQQNTLLVNGSGQVGEGNMWFDGNACLAAQAEARISRVNSTPALDVMTGEAEKAYPAALGLTRYHRHMLFLKPDVLIVIDDIAVNKKAKLELRFHPEHAARERDGSAFLSRGDAAVLRVDPLTPEGLTLSSEVIAGQNRSVDKKPFAMETIRMQCDAVTWRNAVAFSWCGALKAPVAVQLKQDGTRWIFSVGSRTVTFDWQDESVQ